MLVLLVSIALATPPVPRETLCAGREPCTIGERVDAGVDAEGAVVSVYAVGAGNCNVVNWLVVSRGDEVVRAFRLSDGPCSGGRHEMDGRVSGPNQYTYSSTAWGTGTDGRESCTLQLSPLRVVKESVCTDDKGGDTSGSWTRDYLTLQATWDRFEDCLHSDHAQDSHGKTPEYFGRSVPRAPVETAWEGTRLGTCAVQVDSDTAADIIWGEASTEGDARLRALMVSETVLWLEIDDDVWTHATESWLHDDHVEIWAYAEDMSMGEVDPVQWGIRLNDGAIFTGYGSSEGHPQATVRALGDGTRAMRVNLPWSPSRLTVVYSDSDTERRQSLLIGTSRVKRGDARSLGDVWFPEGKVHCERSERGLVPVDTQVLDVTRIEMAVQICRLH
ncbi:MAG: hypothetical protein JRI25_27315 [Deltaproteobacteria bacterium]|nr:hypothetical protein [Deltaproteobacteria bacterium]